MFDFSNVYDGVWPTTESGDPMFSLIIQDNEPFHEAIIDNVYGDQEYFSTVAQDPDHQRQ